MDSQEIIDQLIVAPGNHLEGGHAICARPRAGADDQAIAGCHVRVIRLNIVEQLQGRRGKQRAQVEQGNSLSGTGRPENVHHSAAAGLQQALDVVLEGQDLAIGKCPHPRNNGCPARRHLLALWLMARR
jgi:hypothetical protein